MIHISRRIVLSTYAVLGLPLLVPATPMLAQSQASPSHVVIVNMVDISGTKFAFQPANVNVQPGDTVRFVQTGTAPHNVQFKVTPAGATLGAAMMGPFLLSKGQTYDVVIDKRFTAGRYPYVCVPHETMGMKGTLVVESGPAPQPPTAPLVAAIAQPVGAQRAPSPRPDHAVVVSGFGSVTMTGIKNDVWNSAFKPAISPILLYQMGEDVLVQTEFEIGLEDGATEFELEFAQIDYLRFEHVILSAGKFLLPFGTFGERRHPSWINKLPGSPLIYGMHGMAGGITPVLTDVGAMARYVRPLNADWTLNFSGYVVNGPSQHEDPAEEMAMEEEVVPDLAYGGGSTDNNRNKLVGARVGLLRSSGLEVSFSAFRANWDDENQFALVGSNVSIEYQRGGLELRGEGTIVTQEFQRNPLDAVEQLRSPGYYLEASRKFGAWEPVVRWSRLLDAKSGDEVLRPGNSQFALGIDYWTAPSIPVKVAYEINQSTPDRLIVQWAFGF